MRWVVLVSVLAGCAGGGGETPYMTRLRSQCAAGDRVGCESLASLQADPQKGRVGTSRTNLSGPADVLYDIGLAIVTLP